MKPSLKKAFTFIEMLGVLCIVVILISISTIAFRHGQQKARDMVRKNDLQMIADALISYGNDHGHFPSSIYDENVPRQRVVTISEALNKVTDGGTYGLDSEGRNIVFRINTNFFKADLSEYYKTSVQESSGSQEEGGTSASLSYELNKEKLEKDAEKTDADTTVKQIASVLDLAEKEIPNPTNITGVGNLDYAIVTQGMCASKLQKYLVNNGYISSIPQDPSGESVKLETNICVKEYTEIGNGKNANDIGWSINSCVANSNSGCTQICKSGYIYVSDGNHFALIARMENENNGNYETTLCGTCVLANTCKDTDGKKSFTWTSTDQLPCDITDEFTNTFDCIKNTGVVEYATGQYYFYIY